jgi:hypothetical protein
MSRVSHGGALLEAEASNVMVERGRVERSVAATDIFVMARRRPLDSTPSAGRFTWRRGAPFLDHHGLEALVMPRESKDQKETIHRVMHEYKHGELKTAGSGAKVKNSRQAIAIALHEAGATKQESPAKNKATLRKTKEKERKGQTAEAEAEGKAAQDRTLRGE